MVEGKKRVSEPGLRQQKKQRTRADLLEAAIKAFLEVGYDQTRLEDIAEAVGVTKRTLLRYFPTKAHLVLASQHEALDTFRVAASSRGTRSIIDVWEEHVAVNAEWIAEHAGASSARTLASSEARLLPELLAIQGEYQSLIFEGLMADHADETRDEIFFSVVAAALVGGNYHVGSLYLDRGAASELPTAERSVIDWVRKRLLNAPPSARS